MTIGATPIRRAGPRAALLVALLLLQALVAPSAPAEAQARPRRARTVDVEHYHIALRFDEGRGEVSGATSVTFLPLADGLRELVLDAAGLTVSRVVLEPGGRELAFTIDAEAETLRIALDRAHAAGERATVRIEYSARPARGLSFYPADPADPSRPAQFWSQGEAADNHHWFPCWDAPDDKATSTVEMTVNGRFTTLSNGGLVATRPNPDGTRTFVWEQRQPHSSYLVSVVGGELQNVAAQQRAPVPVSYLVPAALADRVPRSLGRTPEMLRFFAERFGVPYPWAKYTQAVVANFPFAGMENTSATTLAESALLDERAAVDASSEDLVAHELAHQWFGNLVTCRDWSHIWLNEGFATYFAVVWTERDRGRDEYLYEMRGLAYERELVEGAPQRPLVFEDFGHPDEIFFGAPVYSKGAWVVHMLRRHLGEALFWRGIRAYLARYGYSTATTDDLRLALEEASGQQLDWFFEQWVLKPGHPKFRVETRYDAGTRALELTVSQVQDRSKGAPIFRASAPVAIVTASGRRVERVWVDSAESRFTFTLDGPPLLVSFDPEADLLRTLEHEKSPAELEYQLASDAVPARIWAAERLGALGGPRSIAALAGALARDPFHGVREAAAAQLARAGVEEARVPLRRALRDPHPRVRVVAASGLGDPSAASRTVLRTLVGSDPSDAAAVAAMGALVAGRDPDALTVLAEALRSRKRGESAREGALRAMLLHRDARALPHAIEWSRPGRPVGARVAALELLATVGATDPRARRAALAALDDSRPAVRASAAEATARLMGMEAVGALESALGREREEGVREAIRRALTVARRARAA